MKPFGQWEASFLCIPRLCGRRRRSRCDRVLIPQVTVVPEIPIVPEITVVPQVAAVPEIAIVPEIAVVPEVPLALRILLIPQVAVDAHAGAARAENVELAR